MTKWNNLPEEKKAAYRAYRKALRSGELVRPERCQECGEPSKTRKDGSSDIQGHHHLGYSHPLDVIWLCSACHRKETPFAAAENNGGRTNPRFGARHGQAKLTDDLVAEILRSPLHSRQLAAQYNISRRTIRGILDGKAWTHVPR